MTPVCESSQSGQSSPTCAEKLNYSIIIPHKNIPELLIRCVSSIPRRDDLEIIIVDDNSSPEIVDFEHFPFLDTPGVTVVFDKSGKGAGRARNVGLSYATGKWLIFADADDYFNYCFNSVLDAHIDDPADIIYCRVNSVDSEFYTTSPRSEKKNYYIDLYMRQPQQGETILRYLMGAPWGKIIRKQLVDAHFIQFEETIVCNDGRFSHMAGYFAQTIAIDEHAVYCVTTRHGSLTTDHSDDKELIRVRSYGNSNKFVQQHNIQVRYQQLPLLLLRSFLSNYLLYVREMKVLKDMGYTRAELWSGMVAAGLKAIIRRLLRLINKGILILLWKLD